MIVLVGEHDKGKGIPFHPSTVSGRRLRALVAEIGLDCQFDNAFTWDGERRGKDIRYLSGSDVIALGKVAERECIRQGVKCSYLPHPACRSKTQLESLREGLLRLPTQREPDKRDSAASQAFTTPEVLSDLEGLS